MSNCHLHLTINIGRVFNIFYPVNTLLLCVFTVTVLHCTLSCIVIAPVCGGRAVWVCYHDNSKLRASILAKLGLYVKVVTISSWLDFGPPAAPVRGSAAGRKCLAPPYYSQRTVFASLWALFIFVILFFDLPCFWCLLTQVNLLNKTVLLLFRFYCATHICIARLCCGNVCVCVCVWMSVTHRYCV